jgi:hypothetical protein
LEKKQANNNNTNVNFVNLMLMISL